MLNKGVVAISHAQSIAISYLKKFYPNGNLLNFNLLKFIKVCRSILLGTIIANYNP